MNKYNNKIYYIINLILFILLAYMQYSKYKYCILKNNSINELLFAILSEILLFIIIFFIINIINSKIIKLIFILFFYFLSIFDFLSWNFQNRPFQFFDIIQSIHFFIYYSFFLNEISLKFKIKILLIFIFSIIYSILFLKYYFNKKNYLKKYIKFLISIIILIIIFKFNFLNKSSLFSIYDNYNYYKNLKNYINIEKEFKKNIYYKKNVKIKYNNIKYIIIYIIETAPKIYFNNFDSLFINSKNNWLKKHSIIFKNHYSTFPESEKAIFSILSGSYPPIFENYSWKKMKFSNSLPFLLKFDNIDTYLLHTAPLNFHNDIDLYNNLGFNKIYEPKEIYSLIKKEGNKILFNRKEVYKVDSIVIDKAFNIFNVYKKIKKNQKFFMVIAPQSSHAPFQDPPFFDNVENINKHKNDLYKFRKNMLWQFVQIRKIINYLDKNNMLNNVLLIITGDHGLRSPYESKELFTIKPYIQESTFHVPLFIAANSFKRDTINWYTSHIDIAPTILNLLNINYNNNILTGINLLNKCERTIFLMGSSNLGVNGFIRNDSIYSINRYSNIYYKNDSFNFQLGIKIKNIKEIKKINKIFGSFEYYLYNKYKQ